MQSFGQGGSSYLDKETGQFGTVWELELAPVYRGSSGDIYRARAINGPKKGQQGLLKRPTVQADGSYDLDQCQDLENEIRALRGMFARFPLANDQKTVWRARVRIPYILDWGKRSKGKSEYPFVITEEVHGSSLKILAQQNQLTTSIVLRALDGYQRLIVAAHEGDAHEAIVYNDAQVSHLFWLDTYPRELVVIDWGNAQFVDLEQGGQVALEQDWQQFFDLSQQLLSNIQTHHDLSDPILRRQAQNIAQSSSSVELRRQIENIIDATENSLDRDCQALKEILKHTNVKDAERLYNLYRKLENWQILDSNVKLQLDQWPRKLMLSATNRSNIRDIQSANEVFKKHGIRSEFEVTLLDSIVNGMNVSNLMAGCQVLRACLEKNYDSAASLAKRSKFIQVYEILVENGYRGNALKDEVSDLLALLVNQLENRRSIASEYRVAIQRAKENLEKSLANWENIPSKGKRRNLYADVRMSLDAIKPLLQDSSGLRIYKDLQGQELLLHNTLKNWGDANFAEANSGFIKLALSDLDQPYFIQAQNALAQAISAHEWIDQKLPFANQVNSDTLITFNRKFTGIEDSIDEADWIEKKRKELEILVKQNSEKLEDLEETWKEFDMALKQGDYATARAAADDLTSGKSTALTFVEAFENIEKGKFERAFGISDGLSNSEASNNVRFLDHMGALGSFRNWYSQLAVNSGTSTISTIQIILAADPHTDQYAALRVLFKMHENAQILEKEINFIRSGMNRDRKISYLANIHECMDDARKLVPIRSKDSVQEIESQLLRSQVIWSELSAHYKVELNLLKLVGIGLLDDWLSSLLSQCKRIVHLFNFKVIPRRITQSYDIAGWIFSSLLILLTLITYFVSSIGRQDLSSFYYSAVTVVVLVGFLNGLFMWRRERSVYSEIFSNIKSLAKEITLLEKSLNPLSVENKVFQQIQTSRSLEEILGLVKRESRHPLSEYLSKVPQPPKYSDYFRRFTGLPLIFAAILGLGWYVFPPHSSFSNSVSTSPPTFTPLPTSSATPTLTGTPKVTASPNPTGTITPEIIATSTVMPVSTIVPPIEETFCEGFDSKTLVEKFQIFMALKERVLSNNDSPSIICEGKTIEQIRQSIYIQPTGSGRERLIDKIKEQPNIPVPQVGNRYLLLRPGDHFIYWVNDDDAISKTDREFIEIQGNGKDISQLELLFDTPLDEMGQVFSSTQITNAGYGILFSIDPQTNYAFWIEWQPDGIYAIWVAQIMPSGELMNPQQIELTNGLASHLERGKDIKFLVEYGREITLTINDQQLQYQIAPYKIHRIRLGIYGYNDWNQTIRIPIYRLNVATWEIK